MTNAEVIKKAGELRTDRWFRFNSCQAYTSGILEDRYILIKSYSTIVGLVDIANQMFYEIGKYSRTTSKQITQIHNQKFSSFSREFVEGQV